MKIDTNTVLEFLKESNNIENVWDDDSLMQAKYAWDYVIKKKELNTNVVLKTHKILMLHQKGLYPNEKGYFRQCPVYIGGREGKPWFALYELISQWCMKVNNSDLYSNPDIAKICHVEYEQIHPFVDGNGRTGRIFMNWQRHKLQQPLLVIKEKDKYDYYNWF